MKDFWKIGTRSTKLALLQSRNGAEVLCEPFGGKVRFELEAFSSPGDRDLAADLRTAPGDFFTADLDNALREGRIDCAIHSAKDLPDPLPPDIDFFWLPCVEDPRDVIVCRVEEMPERAKVIGVSSERRNAWAAQHFPDAVFKPVRGSIEQRIEQLDAGKFDLLLMAAAALNRLSLQHRISAFIPESELAPPAGQGVLAVTFLKGNETFSRLRQYFVYPAVLAGAGPGSLELLTLGALEALKNCDLCLYDALGFQGLERFLPSGAETLFVGKRMGGHTLKQPEITAMLLNAVRQGRRVVRLKGGDPGLFGRLAEEVDALTELSLPFRVIPGVSALNAATTGTGLLLTRRGNARGFTVLTPRTAGEKNFKVLDAQERLHLPQAVFMSASESRSLCAWRMAEGMPPETPAAAVFNASAPDEKILCATLSTLPDQVENFLSGFETPPPGLILTGSCFTRTALYKPSGLLGGMRVLLTGTAVLNAAAAQAVRRYNGIPLEAPLIELKIRPGAETLLGDLKEVDWLLVSSPTAAQWLLSVVPDIRRMPRVMVCGAGIARVFRSHGILPDAEVKEHFGNEGLLNLIDEVIRPGDRVLRVRSDAASAASAERIQKITPHYREVVFASTQRVDGDQLPKAEVLFLASSSAVRALSIRDPQYLEHTQYIVVIGKPTLQTLQAAFAKVNLQRIILPEVSDSSGAIQALAKAFLSVENP